MVAAAGLAPAFSCFQGTRVDNFSLATLQNLVETTGVAPVTQCLQGIVATTEHASPLKNSGFKVRHLASDETHDSHTPRKAKAEP